MSAWTVTGAIWLSGNDGEWYIEHAVGRIEVQRTDVNEIHLGIALHDSESPDVSFYLTLSEASRLAHMLGAMVLADEAAAHEAAKLAAPGSGTADE